MKKILTASATIAVALLLASCGGPDSGSVTAIDSDKVRPAPKETIGPPGNSVKFTGEEGGKK